MIGMCLTNEEQAKYDSWTKEQIYEAYILEVEVRKALNIEVNKLIDRLAEIRYLASKEDV